MSGFSYLRSDRGQLAPPISATIYEGRVARTHKPGDALIYETGPEHRDAEELAKVVSGLAGLQVYLGHPSVYPASTSGQKAVGYVESGRMDDDTAIARIVITDEETLAAIKAGTHELSLGYACGLDGERYQRNIQLDHLAVVDRARCGAACSMRTDMLEPIEKENNVEVKIELTGELKEKLDTLIELTRRAYGDEAMSLMSSTSMEKCACGEDKAEPEKCTCPKMDGCTCNSHAINHTNGDTMSEQNTELADLNAKLEAANKALTALEIEATNARKDADAAKSKLDAANAETAQAKLDADTAVLKAKTDAEATIASEIQVRVDARVALLVEAKQFLADADLNKMSDREIMCAVVKHVDGDDIAAEKSMDYVSGVYTGALKRGAGAGASRDAARTAIKEMRTDGVQNVMSAAQRESEAKLKMQSDSEVAWTKK